MPHRKLARRFRQGLEEVAEGLPLARRGTKGAARSVHRFVLGALRGGLKEARGGELPANRREKRRDAQLKALERRRDTDQNTE